MQIGNKPAVTTSLTSSFRQETAHTGHTGSENTLVCKFQELQSQFLFPLDSLSVANSPSKVCQGGDFVKDCTEKILSVKENLCLP